MYDRLPQYTGAGHVTWSQEQEKAQLPPRDCPQRGAAETGGREAARGSPRHPDITGPEKGDVSHNQYNLSYPDSGYGYTSEGCYNFVNQNRPKPVGHGYVLSMAVSAIGEWLKLVLFLFRDEEFILRGWGWGGLAVILAVKHLKINILAWAESIGK